MVNNLNGIASRSAAVAPARLDSVPTVKGGVGGTSRAAGNIAGAGDVPVPAYDVGSGPLLAVQKTSKIDLNTDEGKAKAVKKFETSFNLICKTLRGNSVLTQKETEKGTKLLNRVRCLLLMRVSDGIPLKGKQEVFRKHCQTNLDKQGEDETYDRVAERAAGQLKISMGKSANNPLFTLTEVKDAVSKIGISRSGIDDVSAMGDIEKQINYLKKHVQKAVSEGDTALSHCGLPGRIGELYSGKEMQQTEIAGQQPVVLAEPGVVSSTELEDAAVMLFAEYIIDPGVPQDIGDNKRIPSHRAALIDNAFVVTHSEVGLVFSEDNKVLNILHVQRFWGASEKVEIGKPEGRKAGELRPDVKDLKKDLRVEQSEHCLTGLIKIMGELR